MTLFFALLHCVVVIVVDVESLQKRKSERYGRIVGRRAAPTACGAWHCHDCERRARCIALALWRNERAASRQQQRRHDSDNGFDGNIDDCDGLDRNDERHRADEQHDRDHKTANRFDVGIVCGCRIADERRGLSDVSLCRCRCVSLRACRCVKQIRFGALFSIQTRASQASEDAIGDIGNVVDRNDYDKSLLIAEVVEVTQCDVEAATYWIGQASRFARKSEVRATAAALAAALSVVVGARKNRTSKSRPSIATFATVSAIPCESRVFCYFPFRLAR